MLTNWLAPLISEWPSVIQYIVFGGFLALLIMLRYTLFTAVGFVFGTIINKLAPYRRLQKIPFTRAQVFREIAHSLTSVLVFTLVVGAIILMTQPGGRKYTQTLQNWDCFGFGYKSRWCCFYRTGTFIGCIASRTRPAFMSASIKPTICRRIQVHLLRSRFTQSKHFWR